MSMQGLRVDIPAGVFVRGVAQGPTSVNFKVLSKTKKMFRSTSFGVVRFEGLSFCSFPHPEARTPDTAKHRMPKPAP